MNGSSNSLLNLKKVNKMKYKRYEWKDDLNKFIGKKIIDILTTPTNCSCNIILDDGSILFFEDNPYAIKKGDEDENN